MVRVNRLSLAKLPKVATIMKRLMVLVITLVATLVAIAQAAIIQAAKTTQKRLAAKPRKAIQRHLMRQKARLVITIVR